MCIIVLCNYEFVRNLNAYVYVLLSILEPFCNEGSDILTLF